MGGHHVRSRFWLESGVALVSTLLFIGTVVVPDWAETLFGIDPDQSNGSFEWLVTVLVAGLALVFLLAAGREWGLSRRQRPDAVGSISPGGEGTPRG